LAIGLTALLTLASIGSPFASSFAQTGGGQLEVTANFAGRESVATEETIELRLNRPLLPSRERLAVFIGQTDMTSLFAEIGTALSYSPRVIPLPPGETVVIVYLVSPANDWTEIARFTLRVSTEGKKETNRNPDSAQKAASEIKKGDDKSGKSSGPSLQPDKAQKKLGFDRLSVIPSVTLNIKSQPAQSSFPLSNRPDRPTFTDLALQSSFKSDLARGFFNSQTQFDFVGSSFQREALRFGQLGDNAPLIDLASYLMQFQTGKVKYQVGHFSFGTNRHLINSFSSRGVTLLLPLFSRLDFAATAMNGSSIIGLGNFVGLDKRKHQLIGSTLGIEFAPGRPGALRLEVGALNGWLLPVSSFNQSNVNDAERSRGAGLRLLATDPSGRFRLDSGFTRSQFTNPSDPLLNQDASIAAFPSKTRNARYVDAACEILKNFSISKGRKANVTFNFRHEMVDPLFRSLGASIQADKIQNEFSLSGIIGEINTQFSHLRFNDNLANIPSILKSLTRVNTFAVGLPVASFVGDAANLNRLLPRIAYSFNQTRQFGAAVPVRGGFELDPAAIPDQIGTNQSLAADWLIQKLRLGYRFNHSFQNSRQTGRELADLTNVTNVLSFGMSVANSLDLNWDINVDRASNKEALTRDRTVRLAPSINWRPTQKSALASNLSFTFAGDAAGVRRNKNIEFDIQWSCRFGFERDRLRKVQGQFFIRYANRFARTHERLFALNTITKTQILNTGLSFTFF
jgi:hypothetical protein